MCEGVCVERGEGETEGDMGFSLQWCSDYKRCHVSLPALLASSLSLSLGHSSQGQVITVLNPPLLASLPWCGGGR